MSARQCRSQGQGRVLDPLAYDSPTDVAEENADCLIDFFRVPMSKATVVGRGGSIFKIPCGGGNRKGDEG